VVLVLCAQQRRHFAQQHPHRPAVRHDVVHREEQDGLTRGRVQQVSAEQRAGRQIEGCAGLCLGQAQDLSLDDCAVSRARPFP